MPGQEVELFDGSGNLAYGRIESVHRGHFTVRTHHLTHSPRPPGGQIILAVSLAKGERFDWLIEKCCELGADRICPIRFARTAKLGGAPAAADRYERLAIAAAKQCGRLYLPQIDPPANLDESLQRLQRDHPQARHVVGVLAPEAPSAAHYRPTGDTVAWVGPEGGLAPEEEEMLRRHGAQPVRLTLTTLRTETAALALAALLCTARDASHAPPSPRPPDPPANP